jgi:hypothetical protein
MRVAQDDQKGAQAQAFREQHFEEFFESHKRQAHKQARYGKYAECLALNVEKNCVTTVKPVRSLV